MARGNTITYSVTLVTEECCNCGITFAMPEDYRVHLLSKPRTDFYCPNGHRQWYVGKSDATKCREAENLAASLRAENDQLVASNERLTRDVLNKAKRLKSVKQRAKAGMCLHCRRTFVNVERHMSKQHPDK
jgi:hypothetical protein